MLLLHLVRDDDGRLAVDRRRYVAQVRVVQALEVVRVPLQPRPVVRVRAVFKVHGRRGGGACAEAAAGEELHEERSQGGEAGTDDADTGGWC